MKNKAQNVTRLAYSVAEAAASIAVSGRTMHDLVKTGAIAHFRVGQRVLIPADVLHEFIAMQTARNALRRKPEAQSDDTHEDR